MSMFAELKRRNVFRVAVFYIVTTWLLLQVTDVVAPVLNLPEWVARVVLFIMALGFLPALFFAWAFELTPEGIKREKDVDRSQSVTHVTARKLDYMTIAVVVLAVGVLLWDRLTVSESVKGSGSITSETAGSEPAVIEPDPFSPPPAEPEIEDESIAVLPFVNMSADPEQTYFSDGLAESLLHRLAQIKDLRVAARTSSFRFRDHTGDVADIARQLRVANILEGSVQRAGDTVRVTAQLIDADKGFHLWSGTYDRKLDNVFAIQDEIARSVVEALKVTLLGDGEVELSAHETDDIEAYELYLQGRDLLAQFTHASLPQAEKRFGEAIAIDPGFLMAHVSLGQTYINMANTGVIPFSALETKLKPVVDRIFELDPDSGAGHAMEAWRIWQGSREGEAARRLLIRAYEQAPEDSFVALQYATFLDWMGDEAEAVAVASRALERDPLSPDLHLRLGFAYVGLEEFEKALFHARRASMLEPGRGSGLTVQSMVYQRTGRFLKALEIERQNQALDPDDYELPADEAMILLAIGAIDAAQPAVEKAKGMAPNGFLPIVAEAALHYRQGNLDRAGELLVETIRTGPDQRRWGGRAAYEMLRSYALASGNHDVLLKDVAEWGQVTFDNPTIENEIDFWTKLYAVPVLRAAGKEDVAGQIVTNALAYPNRPENSEGILAVAVQDAARTLDALEEGFENGPDLFWWLDLQSPALDFVRDEPRFQALVKRLEDHVAPMKAEVEGSDGSE